MTRNRFAVVQSLVVVGILLLVLGVAGFSLHYQGVAVALWSVGVVSLLGAGIAWTALKPSK
ncbi:hypothetical protein [Nocardia sp. NPDC020380]|uniref:hypothetical protein n=1 Tax=Nocardia sp. NPDC020380 TaxID=3364309 RepID=UPI0037A57CA6